MATPSSMLNQDNRKPAQTRGRILEAAFKEMHLNGYQGMRLDDVLKSTGLTKGALYYHFPNKLALGYAVVDEIIKNMAFEMWVLPLKNARNPMDVLIDRIKNLDKLTGPQITTLGCPLNNLAQEMSPLDEGFRERLDQVFTAWHGGLVDALERAKMSKQLGENVDCQQTATIVMAALEGCIGLTKNSQRIETMHECTRALAGYLESLRVT